MQLNARLRAFAAFARRRSFSGAGRELRISQPAVSKHIADIERELGLLLVERRPRGGALTVAGEFLANHVLRAEGILAQAALGVAEFREPGSGSLTVVASGVTGTYLLPEVIAEFQQAHPGVRIVVELGTSARAVESLRSHHAELGFVSGFVAAPEIEAEPLLEDEIIIVGPRRLADRRFSLRELESLTWISREEGSATRAVVEAACADLGIAPTRRLELPSWEAGGKARLRHRRMQSICGGGGAASQITRHHSGSAMERAQDDVDHSRPRRRAYALSPTVYAHATCPLGQNAIWRLAAKATAR
jgi:DNA-binding transcriptional LysR family regulator